MNIEKTMEFILDMQAKCEERWAKADERFAKSERRLDRIEGILAQTNHVVASLARYGVSFRSDVRELQKFRARSEKWQAKTDENLAEITDKLNGLIDFSDKFRTRSEENLARSHKFQSRTEKNLAEITDKLNDLSDLVEKSLRRNGGHTEH